VLARPSYSFAGNSTLKSRLLVFPHQLFAKHPGLKRNPDEVVLIEDSLFFGDERYPAKFHKQKLWLHRATMRRFEASLNEQGFSTRYLRYERGSDLKTNLKKLPPTSKFILCESTDFILEKRLDRFVTKHGVEIETLPTPYFLNSRDVNEEYRAGKKRWFMADFYKFQRKRLDILMDGDEPFGGQWSFDEDNRKKSRRRCLASGRNYQK